MAPRGSAFICGALCSASWLGVSSAVSIEDALAFFQRSRAMAAIDVPPLPDAGSLGMKIKQLWAGATGDNVFKLRFKPFCNAESTYGPTECVVYYDSIVNASLELNIENGFEVNDTLSTTMNIALGYNTSYPFWHLLPKELTLTKTCTVCGGSCTNTFTSPNVTGTIVMPSNIVGQEFCGTPHNVTINEKGLAFFLPPGYMAPSGKIILVANLWDVAGATKVGAQYEVEFTQSSSAAAVMASDIDDSAKLPLPKFGLHSFLKEAVQSTMTTSIETLMTHLPDGAAELNRDSTKSAASHVFLWDLNVTTMADPTDKFVISFNQGCTAPDALGTVSCEVPYGSEVTASADVKLEADIEEGDTVSVKTAFSVGGDFHDAVKNLMHTTSFFPTTSYTLPLCGPDRNLTLFGRNVTITSPTCGHYKLQFTTNQPFKMEAADFTSFDFPVIPMMPYLPSSLDALLPIKMGVDFVFTKKDGTILAAFTVTGGTGLQ